MESLSGAEERLERKSVMVLGTKEGLKSKLSSAETEPIGSCSWFYVWNSDSIQILQNKKKDRINSVKRRKGKRINNK